MRSVRSLPLLLLLSLPGACVIDTEGYCEVDEQCPADQLCRLPDRTCEAGVRKVKCKTNADCKPNQLCAAPNCLDATNRGELSGTQVTPPTASIGQGTILLRLSQDNSELLYSLSHTVPPETITEVHIHAGKFGTEGVIPLFTLKKE